MAVREHGRGADQVSLRLPPGLRDRVKAAADQNGRSMNAEIIELLEDAYVHQTYAEKSERLAVALMHQRAEDEAASIEKRLTTIEAKLDQLLAIEDHFRAQAKRSGKPSVVVQNEKPLPVRRRKDEETP